MRALSREFRPLDRVRRTLAWCGVVALGLHAAVLLGWRWFPEATPVIEVEGASVEVELVSPPPADEAPAVATATPPAPPPEPPPPTPAPEPKVEEQVPPTKPAEMTLPDPPKPAPAPKPVAKPKIPVVPKPVAKTPSAPPARPDSNRAAAPAPAASTPGNPSGKVAGKATGKPAFVTRPDASYPPESRAAGEHGVVLLHITVNAEGRPTAISVARSCGYPRLDRAAVEGGWRCRVTSTGATAQFDAPVRFDLRD